MSQENVEIARQVAETFNYAYAEGATDLEIHDTVLISAVFCMCNRYVDGLATRAPEGSDYDRERAPMVAAEGCSAGR